MVQNANFKACGYSYAFGRKCILLMHKCRITGIHDVISKCLQDFLSRFWRGENLIKKDKLCRFKTLKRRILTLNFDSNFPAFHVLINYKDTKTKCRLYRCLIEFIDRRYSQSCWYFRPSFVNHCPSNLLSYSPSPT